MPPIRIETIADLLEAGYEVHATCWSCRRYNAPVDLKALVESGLGQESIINRRWVCSTCGKPGAITISPVQAQGYVRRYPGR